MQWLPRGTEINSETRITKIFATGDKWQMYHTNNMKIALAVLPELYEYWIENYNISDQLFKKIDSYFTLVGNNKYLVSSMKYGPYPSQEAQIVAFSKTLHDTLEKQPDLVISDGIYIEEYSLLLPGNIDVNEDIQNDAAFGTWLSGGLGVSVKSFDRLTKVVSWIPQDRMYKYVTDAGFELDSKVAVDENDTNHSNRGPSERGQFSLIGRPELETFFIDNIIDIVNNKEKYKRMGIDFPGATILYGPPGCGKTYAVDRLAEYLDWPRYDIDASTIASSFIHDTSKKIGEVFNLAIKNAPSIIVIDEMEAFLSDRQSAGGTSEHHTEEIAEFLRRIPEAISKDVLIFAMTNLIDQIDPAILRRGRFDHVIEVKMPSKDEIIVLLNQKFKELPISSDVNNEEIAEALDGHAMSDVTFIIKEAGRYAVKNNLEVINMECFDSALSQLDSSRNKKKQFGFRG